MSGKRSLGFVRVGSLSLAIPAEIIEEVAYGPFLVQAVPEMGSVTIGFVALRGQPIPVLELSRLIGDRTSTWTGESIDRILVLARDGKRLAVRVDSVQDVRVVNSVELASMDSQSGLCLFQEVHTCPRSGCVSTLLDLSILESLEGVRPVRSKRTAKSGKGLRELGAGTGYVVFRAGTMRFALSADLVKIIDKEPEQLDSLMVGGALRGFHKYRGQLISFINFGLYAGFPSVEALSLKSPTIVVRNGSQSLGLVVDEVLTIQSYGGAQLAPVDPIGYEKKELFEHVAIEADGAPTILVHAGRFLESLVKEDLFSISDTLAEESCVGRATEAPTHYLVYETLGFLLATELGQLEAVSNIPEHFREINSGQRGLVGVCSHLGKPVNVFQLSRILGYDDKQRREKEDRLLIVRNEIGLVAYLVDTVRFLQWAAPTVIPTSGAGVSRIIQTTQTANRMAASVIDLKGLSAMAGSSC